MLRDITNNKEKKEEYEKTWRKNKFNTQKRNDGGGKHMCKFFPHLFYFLYVP